MAEGVGDEKASGRTPPVFISYASQDAAVAATSVEALERASLKCWIAPRDVTPGTLYADEIVGAINEAKVVVLILSEHSAASPHVGKEIERASSKRRPILALRTDTSPLPRAFEYFLSESQWIDVRSGSIEAAVVKLVEAVRRHLGPVSAVEPNASLAPAIPDRRPAAPRRRWVLLASVVLAALVLVYFGVDRIWLTRQVPTKQPESAATSIVADKSIAVLPFTDLSEKKNQEYFADGIAEEVLNRLAKVPGLRVVGRTSSFQFKGKTADAPSIGAALSVAYLLEGSVRREAGRVRVAAQLIEAHTGAERWSDHFDSDVTDVLGLQDTIAAELARALQITVEADAAPRASVKSPEALDAYLRGRQYLDRSTREGCEAAIANFQQALALDPAFAPAAVGLADTYIVIGENGWLPTRTAFQRAREAAELARRLDPKAIAPHVELAAIHTYYDWDWAGADRELQQAFALGPRETNGVQIASEVAAARGHWDEARQLAIESIELDPLNPTAHIILGWNIYLHTDQFAEAERSLRRTLEIAPHWGSGQYLLGEALMLEGNPDAALAEFQKETLDDGRLEGSAMALFAAGRKAESDAQLAAGIRHNGTSWPSEIARVYAFRGEKDHAFEWLDKAYQLRDEDLWLIKDDPLFKNVEGDRRYKAFLRKMDLPE